MSESMTISVPVGRRAMVIPRDRISDDRLIPLGFRVERVLRLPAYERIAVATLHSAGFSIECVVEFPESHRDHVVQVCGSTFGPAGKMLEAEA